MSQSSNRAQLLRAIEEAFAAEEPVAVPELAAAKFRQSMDIADMEVALAGKHWRSIDPEVLFEHRATLGMLSAKGYRSLLPAYLRASLGSGDDSRDSHDADLFESVLFSLHPLSDDPTRVAETDERLSLLTDSQRDAIEIYLHRAAAEYDDRDAKVILASWPRATAKTGQ